MPSSVSRRTVTTGLAWSVPAVAAVSAAPAFAASSPATTPQCSDNIPAVAGPFWPTNGAHTVSSTGGGPTTNVTTTYNFGVNDRSSTGSVTMKFYDGSSQTYVAQPYVTLNNGVTYTGFASLGGTQSFVAPTGVSGSVAVNWYGTAATNASNLWSGVTAHVPFIYYWTDPKTGVVYSAQYELLVTYPAANAFSAGVQPTTVQYVRPSYGCQAVTYPQPTITDISPNYPAAGSTITIKGTGFTGATTVMYDGVNLTFTAVNATTVTAVMPNPWPAGTAWGTIYDVVVCNPSACSDGYGIARGV